MESEYIPGIICGIIGWAILTKAITRPGLCNLINLISAAVELLVRGTDCSVIVPICHRLAGFYIVDTLVPKDEFALALTIHHILAATILYFEDFCNPMLFNYLCLLEFSSIFFSLRRTGYLPKAVADNLFASIFLVIRVVILIPYTIMVFSHVSTMAQIIVIGVTILNIMWSKIICVTMWEKFTKQPVIESKRVE